MLLGWIQDVRYGSPLASGYGTASDMFSLEYVLPNLARYPRWITESHTLFIWLSIAAPFWIVRRATNARLAWSALAACGRGVDCVSAVHVLSAERVVLHTVSAAGYSDHAVLRGGMRTRGRSRAAGSVASSAVAAIVTIGVAAASVMYAERHKAFDIRNQERKYPLAGEFVRDQGPGQRIRARRAAQRQHPLLREPSDASMGSALADAAGPGARDVRAQGYEPILVVDAGEYEAFRERFEATGQRAVHSSRRWRSLGDARVFAFR